LVSAMNLLFSGEKRAAKVLAPLATAGSTAFEMLHQIACPTVLFENAEAEGHSDASIVERYAALAQDGGRNALGSARNQTAAALFLVFVTAV